GAAAWGAAAWGAAAWGAAAWGAAAWGAAACVETGSCISVPAAACATGVVVVSGAMVSERGVAVEAGEFGE
ncbi:MAG: hypothetical protein JWN98_1042, partial [Abditibacteriota bacterium]|nr:hypothetical protein [Abditibacteriota bacterium]